MEAEDQATTVARYLSVSDERGEYHILGLPSGGYVLLSNSPDSAASAIGIVLRLGEPH